MRLLYIVFILNSFYILAISYYYSLYPLCKNLLLANTIFALRICTIPILIISVKDIVFLLQSLFYWNLV